MDPGGGSLAGPGPLRGQTPMTWPKVRSSARCFRPHARRMPRQPRIERAGLIHHATGHSVAQVNAFPDDTARRGFLTLLANMTTIFNWRVLAYCLLPSHYHLLVETQLPNLGEGMRRLHSSRSAAQRTLPPFWPTLARPVPQSRRGNGRARHPRGGLHRYEPRCGRPRAHAEEWALEFISGECRARRASSVLA